MPDLQQSASRGIVMRNQINFGMDCYQIDASSNVIFEDNHCLGINLFSRGSGTKLVHHNKVYRSYYLLSYTLFALISSLSFAIWCAAAGSTYGGPAATGVFFARNSEKFVFGGDQEELTTDAGYANYFGTVSPSTDGLTLTMATDPSYPEWCDPNTGCRYLDSNRTGAAVYVLAGEGAGQMRVVTGGGTAYNRSWEIDKPFGGSGGGVRTGSAHVHSTDRFCRVVYAINIALD